MKTVNFIDAVNSGKRFKKDTGDSIHFTWLSSGKLSYGIFGREIPVTSELVNSQFIIEEKTITITESELKYACDLIQKNFPAKKGGDLFDYLKWELDF